MNGTSRPAFAVADLTGWKEDRAMIADVFRWVLSSTLGWRWVDLVDYNGNIHVRRARVRYGAWGAWRVGMRVRWVWLLDGGRIAGCGYVYAWSVHTPFAETRSRVPFPSDGVSQ